MSVQVSYKNQFVVYIFLLLIFLIVVELFANFWIYNIYRCDFESNEIFKDVDPETNRKLCLEGLEYDFTKETIPMTLAEAQKKEKLVQLNSHYIRAPEITLQKPENTIRIFTVGASTTFGTGVLDNETYPYFLQTMFDKSELNFNVEIINAGIMSEFSYGENKLIKIRSPRPPPSSASASATCGHCCPRSPTAAWAPGWSSPSSRCASG